MNLSDSESDSVLGELTRLVVPPTSGGTHVDWDRAEREYGHRFPGDYAEFMKVYGEGVFDDFLSVSPPFPDAFPRDPSSCVRGVSDNARAEAEEDEYDSPELLIGWGNTVDADLLCWRAADVDPNRWTSVIWRRQWSSPDSWVELDCGMVELLCRWATDGIPHFGVTSLELPYRGSRFVRSLDKRSLRERGIDPWGRDFVQ